MPLCTTSLSGVEMTRASHSPAATHFKNTSGSGKCSIMSTAITMSAAGDGPRKSDVYHLFLGYFWRKKEIAGSTSVPPVKNPSAEGKYLNNLNADPVPISRTFLQFRSFAIPAARLYTLS